VFGKSDYELPNEYIDDDLLQLDCGRKVDQKNTYKWTKADDEEREETGEEPDEWKHS